MKLRNPFLIKSAALLGSALISRLMNTISIHADFSTSGPQPTDPRKQRFIYVIWHELMLAPTLFRTPARILISQHSDGELIARAVRHLGFGVIRGSTTRGGTAALYEMIQSAQNSHLFITPDGPRGPRRIAQSGAVYLASQTGLPILPLGVAYENAVRMRSWDRFAVPLPYSRLFGVAGVPMFVPSGLDSAGLKQHTQRLQDGLDDATGRAERWLELTRKMGVSNHSRKERMVVEMRKGRQAGKTGATEPV